MARMFKKAAQLFRSKRQSKVPANWEWILKSGVPPRQYRRTALPDPDDFEAKEQITVNIPQAETAFWPPLFMPTRNWKSGTLRGSLDIQNALMCLRCGLEEAGYWVNKCSNDSAESIVNWSGKTDLGVDDVKNIYIEHGWLPRWSYQVSSEGTNSQSHIAKSWKFEKLDDPLRKHILSYVEKLKSIYQQRVSSEQEREIRELISEPFILFPLQLANDFNLKNSNSGFEHLHSRKPEGNLLFAQACVDYVESFDLPLPVVFKQHPADRTVLSEKLKFSKGTSFFWDKRKNFSTHSIFSTGLCRLIISINSNTVHEASIWNIPSICLGALLWQNNTEDRPYSRDLGDVQQLLECSHLEDERVLAYLSHVVRNQWNLDDFLNPVMVKTLVESKGACEPYALRCKLGLV